MAPPPPKQPAPPPGEEEEYESDEYDVEDDDEADTDFKGAEDERDEEEEEDEDEDESGDDEETGQSLTALLVADPNLPTQLVDEEDDEGYAPPGENDPADDPIDGNARAETPAQVPDVDDPLSGKGVARVTTAPAGGIKRKTSGDEEDGNDGEDDLEAKRLKS